MTLLLTLALLGLTVGSLYALFAVSFAVIYNVTHIFHLAHGAVIGAAGYVVFFLAAKLSWPVWLAILAAVPVAAALGAAIELAFYRPLRRRDAPHVAFFLTSVGILIVAEGLFGTIFGPGVMAFSFLPLAAVPLGPTTLPNANLAMLAAWSFISLAVAYVLATRTGRFMRAVADTPGVAASVGVDLDRTYLVELSPRLGAHRAGRRTLRMDAGTHPAERAQRVTGGVGRGRHRRPHRPFAGAIAALFLGIVQAMALVFLPSGWQDAVVFTLLFLVIAVRPDGVFGRAFRW